AVLATDTAWPRALPACTNAPQPTAATVRQTIVRVFMVPSSCPIDERTPPLVWSLIRKFLEFKNALRPVEFPGCSRTGFVPGPSIAASRLVGGVRPGRR